MNSQTIVTRANANHFGHTGTNHGHDLPAKAPAEKAALSAKAGTNGAPQRSGKSRKQSAQSPALDSQRGAPIHGAPGNTIFWLNHSSAKTVLLAGEFTNWDKEPIAMARDKNGIWQATVPLPPGRYRYRFLVDGEWHDDPHANDWVPNPFGTHDAMIEVI